MAKIGILISMAPDDLQDTILQHADKLKWLLDVRAGLEVPTRWTSAALVKIGGGMTAGRVDVDVAAVGKGGETGRSGGGVPKGGATKGGAPKGGGVQNFALSFPLAPLRRLWGRRGCTRQPVSPNGHI